MERKEHRVVKETFNMVLIVGDEADVAIEDFAHLEDAGSSSVLAPKVFGNLRDRINTDSVKVVSGNNFVDPLFEIGANVGV